VLGGSKLSNFKIGEPNSTNDENKGSKTVIKPKKIAISII
jgi:hypothetical protein